jgi:hypothetical protein
MVFMLAGSLNTQGREEAVTTVTTVTGIDELRVLQWGSVTFLNLFKQRIPSKIRVNEYGKQSAGFLCGLQYIPLSDP